MSVGEEFSTMICPPFPTLHARTSTLIKTPADVLAIAAIAERFPLPVRFLVRSTCAFEILVVKFGKQCCGL